MQYNNRTLHARGKENNYSFVLKNKINNLSNHYLKKTTYHYIDEPIDFKKGINPQ